MLYCYLGRGAEKGALAAEPLVDNDAQRVLIAGRARFPHDLLRSHIRDGASSFLRIQRTATMGDRSDAKVTQPDLIGWTQQEIIWFDISMDQFAIMGILQGCRNLA